MHSVNFVAKIFRRFDIFTDFKDIDTPALLIEKHKLEANILNMQKIADSNNVRLRPHIKTHKIPEIAKMQIACGARGIATAKLGEAEVMAEYGIEEIQIANIIVGSQKIERLLALSQKIKSLTCSVDSVANAAELSKAAAKRGIKLKVLIEIDTGHERNGLKHFRDIIMLARFIGESSGLTLAGILTHAGQIYASKNRDEVMNTGFSEGEQMVAIADKLRSAGIGIDEISVGSTPGAPYSSAVKGVTELRAGNYVYYDNIQVSLGSATIEDCALTILSMVISTPKNSRSVIDAGSKALSLDKGAHSIATLDSFGYIYDKKVKIVRLSEEHGIIQHTAESFSVGEKIRINPNHACAVSNLFDYAYLVDGEEIVEKYHIAARGKSQ